MKEKEAEFIGFFYADGCVSLHTRKVSNKYVRKDGTTGENHTTTVCRVQITQRVDNMVFLKQLKEYFGGHIYIQNENSVKMGRYKSNQTAYWAVQSIPLCKRVLEILLKSSFTYRSYDAVKSAHEFCIWKMERGLQKKLTQEDQKKVEAWRNRVRNAHKFKS